MSEIAGWILRVSSTMLILALLLSAVRVLRGPSLPDRVVALDLSLYLAVGVMNLWAQRTEETAFMDVALVLALIAFLGTVAFASYLERGR